MYPLHQYIIHGLGFCPSLVHAETNTTTCENVARTIRPCLRVMATLGRGITDFVLLPALMILMAALGSIMSERRYATSNSCTFVAVATKTSAGKMYVVKQRVSSSFQTILTFEQLPVLTPINVVQLPNLPSEFS